MGEFLKIGAVIKSLGEYYAIICFLDTILKITLQESWLNYHNIPMELHTL